MKTLALSTSWPWIGQQAFGQAAKAMLDRGEWPATVLFSGAENLGKQTIAMWLAQRQLCQNTSRCPCGTCTDCRQVTAGAHPSLLTFNSDDAAVSMQEMQQAVQRLKWKTNTAERRWVILPDIERLSEAVGNSLLKLIEEPPVGTSIIMTTSQPDRVLPTLRSRAIEFMWHRVSHAELDQAIQKNFPALSPSVRRLITRHANGRPGLAINYATRPEQLTERWDTVQILQRGLVSGRWPQRREWVAGDLDETEALVRDALLSSIGIPPRTWTNETSTIQNFSMSIGSGRLAQLARRLTNRHALLRQHVQPSFILHDLSF